MKHLKKIKLILYCEKKMHPSGRLIKIYLWLHWLHIYHTCHKNFELFKLQIDTRPYRKYSVKDVYNCRLIQEPIIENTQLKKYVESVTMKQHGVKHNGCSGPNQTSLEETCHL